MSKITYDYMEGYIRGLIPESEGRLKELEVFATENGVPIAQKETIKFLEFMVSMKKPLKILELGTAIGYSAIIMHDAAKTNPHITTIERSEEMIKYAKENIKSFGLEDKIIIEEGDCLEILEKLKEPYDLIFMDAGKGHYNHFLPHCLRLLKEDGIIGFCTFHQSYSYEDFVEGLRSDGKGGFEPKDGIFRQICENASIKAQTELPK
ncbi:O-methyltransferase, partial [uncultured Clostridium sp.]|uniref:O-methyltransferase n=1 Tax=uncultured Clostridium sp. TaxID=59620 RepID=UPI002629A76F